MKRKASAAIAALLVMSVIAGCNPRTTKSEKDVSSSDTSAGSSSVSSDTEREKAVSNPMDPDRVFLTSEFHNYAWGAQETYQIVLGDGRMYNIDGVILPVDGSKEKGLKRKVEILKTMEPFAVIDADYLQLLYENASRIDPEAKCETKPRARDAGQRGLFYWAEDGTKIRCFETGDTEYIIDDSYATNTSKLWEEIRFHMNKGAGSSDLKILNEPNAPETIHCGYINLEEGDSGKYLFESYGAFDIQAAKWGVELSQFEWLKTIPDDDLAKKWFFVQLDIVPSSGYQRDYDAFVIDGKVHSFHPSKDWKDPDPGSVVLTMMDGFMTIYIISRPKDVSLPYEALSEDGTSWKVVQ